MEGGLPLGEPAVRVVVQFRGGHTSVMKRFYYLPVLLLLALLFGGLPAARQIMSSLYELTLVEGHGQQITTPVVMYSTQWCPYCRKAHAYFKRHQISYVDYDIEASAQNLANFRALNGRGVPLITVGDKRMQGFSPKSFEDLLK